MPNQHHISRMCGAHRIYSHIGGIVLSTVLCTTAVPAQPSFVSFESGPVRPVALSPSGNRLFVANIPDARLEIFDVLPSGLQHATSVPVGLEPVALAARTDTEVWVVNHLSDSVTIVDVGSVPPRAVRTLLVGDEPRDIVFAGPRDGPTGPFTRAFITTAHRGQNGPVDPSLTTPDVGRADVWVFDATDLGTALGGTPKVVLSLFGDTPRALAASADGTEVFAAVFHSGNQTTVVNEGLVCDGGASVGSCNVEGVTMPGGLPAPNANVGGDPAPETGLIVRFDGADWVDELGRNWNNAVRFDLPDLDVFRIDAMADPPAETGAFAHVGTVLFNMVVNPFSGVLYVSNTEARNEVRFEGPGSIGTTVRGHLHEARITVIDGATVTPWHLNSHIDYSQVPVPAGVKERSLATPVGMAVTSDGATLYVAAFGSSKIGTIATQSLETGGFVPDAADHIPVTGGGPAGLALDEINGRLYVLTRFDNGVSVIDLTPGSEAEIEHIALHNPEPPQVVAGRPFLYDATFTSSNGEASCAGCHVFGDLDSLAWDLGDPDGVVINNPIPARLQIAESLFGVSKDFHPMKGPMTTQTLRGMVNHGSMHWRGDRTGGNDVGGSPFDSDAAFRKFNVAFGGLLGRDLGPIPTANMQQFADFILEVALPPNPIRNLDNSLTAEQQAGKDFMIGARRSDGLADDIGGLELGFNCVGCHTLDPAQGFFGTDGQASFENEPQFMKIPHLRNLYQKVGMFGMAETEFIETRTAGEVAHMGDQIRGFGFLHDGSADTVFRFLRATVFSDDPSINPFGPFGGGVGVGFNGPQGGDVKRRQVEAFCLAFDADLAPIVGQQITLTDTNAGVVTPRITFLIQRSEAAFASEILGGTVTECDLIAKGTSAGEQRGFVYVGGGNWDSDRASEGLRSTGAVQALASTPGQEITFTCTPPGSGVRMGIDRDGDGFRDRDELDAGSDPADPGSTPGGGTTTSTTMTTSTTATSTTTSTIPPGGIVTMQTTVMKLKDDGVPPINPDRRRIRFRSRTKADPPANQIVPAALGSAGDPTVSGAMVTVYNSAGGSDIAMAMLPAARWKAVGNAGNHRGYAYRDPDPNAPIRRVRVTTNRLAIVGGRSAWAYTLDEPFQGRIGIRVALGAGMTLCAEAGQPGFAPRRDELGLYVGRPRTPAPATCPAVPGGSPSAAFAVVEGALY